jgi:putative sterol carrier protein
MARSLQQVIQDAKAVSFDARFKNVEGSYRFDIEGVGSFRLEVHDGRLSFYEDGAPADCVIAGSADEFVKIAEGQHNMLTAYMQGRVRIEGDLPLAKLLHGILPAAPKGHDEKHP